MVKASLESIAYQIAEVIFCMQQDQDKIETLYVDGGAVQNGYLMQFQSDILHTRVETAECEESSAFGVALLAGLSHGIYEKIRETEHRGRCYEPKMDKILQQKKWLGWKKAVNKAAEE